MSRQGEILRRVLSGEGLPSLSAVALQVVKAAADDSCGAADLARIIENDPGLTSRILRLANSALYRRSPEPVVSVSRAVVLLGVHEIRFLALSLGLREALGNEPGGPDYLLFWRTSLHRALLGRQLAGQADAGLAPEEVFVAGLLLELGLPLLLRVLSAQEVKGFPGFHQSLEQILAWEAEELGVDHREIGAEAMRRWELPEVLIQCQRLPGPEEEALAPMVLMVDLARLGAESFFAPGVELSVVHEAAERRFGLAPEVVNQMLVESLSLAAETGEALEIELDAREDLEAVLAKVEAALGGLRERVTPALRRLVASQAGVKDLALGETLAVMEKTLREVDDLARRLKEVAGEASELRERTDKALAQAERLEQALGHFEDFTEF